MPVKTFRLDGARPEGAAWRVLLVPHAGAGAASGAAFAAHCPADWAVATARLPGRESRVREPVGGLAELTADVVATARALPGSAPLLVVGVCSGAVLALEAVRALQRTGDVSVAGFVAVSQWAVTEKPDPGRRRLRDTDDPEEILDILREFGGVPASLAANKEMLALLLPSIVADMRAVEEYSSGPEPLLDCPLLAVFGDEDPLCPEERTEDWELFSDRSRTVWLPGGHLLLTESPALLAEAVAGSVDHFAKGARA
ncbi:MULTISPECIES: thioesterase domain-containing protein [unclassified Streptomyces]|uniref:thioesterase II family protein n=1 Tax=unclassified Streptomyces TaxID=2593676 RepID=UPI000DBA19C8|nr:MULTISPECIES: thioesterase domain-containing protein [unclassified Streptomyces]MYT74073.1 alpha/beta fold hydrolase [Streptomyces sp. SID8367]RAJ89490.1 surfactin synthase thioesterase subunit [Streptomyces sp. PsTaAH-137]